MGDDGSSHNKGLIKGFLDEWNLFWDGVSEEKLGERNNQLAHLDFDENQIEAISRNRESGKIETLTIEDVRNIMKNLSDSRKTINQKLEFVQKEIDLNQLKLESIRLVGGNDQDVLKRISDLTTQGVDLATELDGLNRKIEMARKKEESLRRPRKDS